MTLKQSGSSVEGNYAHSGGHVKGRLNGSSFTIQPLAGNVLTARWDQDPTHKGPTDAGPVVFTMQADGRSFAGNWAYDRTPSARNSNWHGTCIAGDCLLNAGIVPISTVSNGCGGGNWATIVAVQNYLGNTSVYKNSNINPAAESFTVNFVEACNLHDAGYSGAIVQDILRGQIDDFRNWSRKQVDDKFLADMRFLCMRQIPARAATALENCKATGGNFSFGAESRYNLVRKIGNNFFDADLTKPGDQETGERANN